MKRESTRNHVYIVGRRRLERAAVVARHAERPQLAGEHVDCRFGVVGHDADVHDAEVLEARHVGGRDVDAARERALADVQVLQRREAAVLEAARAQHHEPIQRAVDTGAVNVRRPDTAQPISMHVISQASSDMVSTQVCVTSTPGHEKIDVAEREEGVAGRPWR